MKTSMIALKAPNRWKPPWKMPKTDTQLNPKTPAGDAMHNNLKYKLGETLKGVQNFIKKHWLDD